MALRQLPASWRRGASLLGSRGLGQDTQHRLCAPSGSTVVWADHLGALTRPEGAVRTRIKVFAKEIRDEFGRVRVSQEKATRIAFDKIEDAMKIDGMEWLYMESGRRYNKPTLQRQMDKNRASRTARILKLKQLVAILKHKKPHLRDK